MTPLIEKYFNDRDIEVNFNTLASSTELIVSYILSTKSRVESLPGKKSQFSKYNCYKQFYDLEQRMPKTGFEGFSTLDAFCRANNAIYITENGPKRIDVPKPVFSPTVEVTVPNFIQIGRAHV